MRDWIERCFGFGADRRMTAAAGKITAAITALNEEENTASLALNVAQEKARTANGEAAQRNANELVVVYQNQVAGIRRNRKILADELASINNAVSGQGQQLMVGLNASAAAKKGFY